MTRWSEEDLRTIGDAQELELATRRADGSVGRSIGPDAHRVTVSLVRSTA